MKFFTGWFWAAGLVVVSAGAQAQTLAPYEAGRASAYTPVSDVRGPYAAVLPEAPRPGYGPRLLPPTEVYTVVRESGFSPLGAPQQRGFIYTIAVIDRGGDDGRLIIDARSGRIVRFIPAYRTGDQFNDDLTFSYGAPGRLPPLTHVSAPPRPPRSIPHVASRTVPLPKVSPLAAKPAAAPEPVQQSAAALPKPVEAPAPPQAAITTGSAQVRSVPQIAPTQDMPVVQGLD